MPSITIDLDLKEALADGRISWAEAGEIRELRKQARLAEKKEDALKAKLVPVQAEIEAIDVKMIPLYAKLDNVAGAEAAEEDNAPDTVTV